MKLYIRQKVFSWNDKFFVKDAAGGDIYSVEGEIFSLGKRLHIYDMAGTELAEIKQKLLTLLPRYEVIIDGRAVAEIVKEFTFLFPKYSIEGLGWEIDGRIMEHDYEIRCGGTLIATICKEWMTWGDCYELDIAHPDDALLALAVVLAIDCVIDNRN